MYIDFGNGEAIRTRHEEEVLRGLEARALRHQARQFRQARTGSRGWLARHWDRFLCGLAGRRIVLARRLEHHELAQWILQGEQATISSDNHCV